jgi:hypothetical protein
MSQTFVQCGGKLECHDVLGKNVLGEGLLYIYACTVKLHGAWIVKNALVKSV